MTPADFEQFMATIQPDRDGKIQKPPEHALRMLEEMEARTSLSWKAKQLYLTPRKGRWSVTMSIDGFRLIASRNPEYAGQADVLWKADQDSEWSDCPPPGNPYAAKAGVIRLRSGVQVTTSAVALWSSYNGGVNLWKQMPATMLAKCAEMLALRKAFPADFSGIYGQEEMDQANRPLPVDEAPAALATGDAVEARLMATIAAATGPELDGVLAATRLAREQGELTPDRVVRLADAMKARRAALLATVAE